MPSHDVSHDVEGVLRRQKVNVYGAAVLIVLGFGSITYGYTASVISTTLGTDKSLTNSQYSR